MSTIVRSIRSIIIASALIGVAGCASSQYNGNDGRYKSYKLPPNVDIVEYAGLKSSDTIPSRDNISQEEDYSDFKAFMGDDVEYTADWIDNIPSYNEKDVTLGYVFKTNDLLMKVVGFKYDNITLDEGKQNIQWIKAVEYIYIHLD